MLQAAPHDVRNLSGAGSVLIRRVEPRRPRDAHDTARGIDGTEAKAQRAPVLINRAAAVVFPSLLQHWSCAVKRSTLTMAAGPG
jgi:hypothetical protein